VLSTGDFWVTAERLQLGASFILPYGTDDFHLVTKATSNTISFTEQLAKVAFTLR